MLIKALLCLSQLGRAVEFIQLEEALNHSNDKTSLVKPKALLPLDDLGVTLFFLVKVPWSLARSSSHPNWRSRMGNFSDRCYSACAHLVGVGVDLILYELNQPVTSSQFVQIYLQTNIVSIYRAMSGITTVGFRRLLRLGFLAVLRPWACCWNHYWWQLPLSNGLLGIQSVALNSRVALQGLSMLGLTTVPWRFIPWF